MKVKDLYSRAVRLLEQNGCEDAAFDARCLLEDVGGLPKHTPLLSGEAEMPAEKAAAVLEAVGRRATGYPLQYLLGNWDFLNLTLAVGDGVLIPRPDTERLCEVAAEWLNLHAQAGATVLDLCAGTGCVGLGVASLCRRPLNITAVEYADTALSYLRQNAARYPQYAVRAVQADVLRDAASFGGGYTALLSNPPYIPTADLPSLMREVQYEPREALDGDTDGLRFYRQIAENWVAHLRPGGLCAVEVGIGQAEAVAVLFEQAGLQNVRTAADYAGVLRVVAGERAAE